LCLVARLLALAGAAGAGRTQAAPPAEPTALLVVLTETGAERDGLPVLAPHPDGARIAAELDRGLIAELLLVYRMEQTYLKARRGFEPKPAYLLLSSQQGGFARYGFWLGDALERDTAFVDLQRDQPLTGRFGAIDQIFPHELAHVLRKQLVGPLTEGNANQVHALGVRTDAETAFDEGFAEHFQVLAVDHPDAAPDTRALASSREELERVDQRLAGYRRELEARVALATPLRVGFALWYSHGEQVLRYHAVLANAFAREPELPERLLAGPDPYAAYLLENVLPGAPDASPKPLARMALCEGVVSALFVRWLRDPGLLATRRDPRFYEPFGVRADQPSPLQNAYLKIAFVLDESKPRSVLEFVDGYRRAFPDETPSVERVTREAFLGHELAAPPEIWLATPDFHVGTTLFDQFRGVPREHTFEINAASIVDWLAVPGTSVELARQLLSHAPYASLDELAHVPGVDAAWLARTRALQAELERLRASADDQSSLSIASILLPSVWRLALAVVIAGVLAAWPYRRVRERIGLRTSWKRALVAGLGASSCAWPWAWFASPFGAVGGAAVTVLGVTLVLGVPAATWALLRHRDRSRAFAACLAWAFAALPMAILATPWG
jgi:hypothetical protein